MRRPQVPQLPVSVLTPNVLLVERGDVTAKPHFLIDMEYRIQFGVETLSRDYAFARAALKMGWVLYDVQKWGQC